MPVRLAVRDGQRADLLASILVRLHLNCGQIFNAARGATVTRRVWASWSVVLLLCLAVILVHGDGWVQNRIHNRGSVTLLMNVKDRPNIYHVRLDGFGLQAILRGVLGVDASDFTRSITSRMIIDSVFAADLPKLPDVSDDWARSRLYDFVAALDRLELSSAGADAPDHI